MNTKLTEQAAKTLVLMSDNRIPETDRDAAGYYSLATYINAVYCVKYGYKFAYYQPYLSHTHASEAARRDPATIPPLSRDYVPKQRPSCYNSLLDQYRAAPWAKLVSLRYALSLRYDRVVYIDSDCVFADQHTSIEEFIEKTPVQAGRPFASSCVGFLKNRWRSAFYNDDDDDDLPCAGFLIAKNCQLTLSFIEEWWNFSNPNYDFSHPYEQSSLHKIFANHVNHLCVWDAIFFYEIEGQFLRHVFPPDRKSYFDKIVGELEAQGRGSFSEIMSEVKTHHLFHLDTCAAAFNLKF